MSTTPFQIKDFALLEQSLLNYIYKSDNALTDFNVGSVMRTLLGAVAAEQEELYFRLWQGIQNAIKDSILQTFDFTPVAGTTASGSVKFKRETAALADYTIVEGTILISANGVKYQTTEEVILLIGTTEITASAISILTGSNTNLLTIGAPLQIVNPIYGISSAETATTFSGGSDVETYQSVLSRFTSFINSLSRGTLRAIEYGASLASYNSELVKKVKAVDYPVSKGIVDVYIDDGSGSATSNLIAESQKIVDGYMDGDIPIEGYKAAGIVATVNAVTKVDVDVTTTITTTNFNTVKGFVEAAITDYFTNDLGIGDDVNYERLIAVIFYAHSEITDVVVSVPTADVVIADSERAILSTLTVSEG